MSRLLFEETTRDVVISERAAVDVPFSFVFCGDSCTPAGPDDPGVIPRGPDNEKKKRKQQKQNRNLKWAG